MELKKTTELRTHEPYTVLAIRKVTTHELGDKVVLDLKALNEDEENFSYFLPTRYSDIMMADPNFTQYTKKCPGLTMTFLGKNYEGQFGSAILKFVHTDLDADSGSTPTPPRGSVDNMSTTSSSTSIDKTSKI